MKQANSKNNKKPLIFKITLILQFGWLAILLIDFIIMLIFHTSIFSKELYGGDVVETIGLGYIITTYYPLTTMDDPVQSTTHINAIVLICGQLILTIANIVQAVRFKNRDKKDIK